MDAAGVARWLGNPPRLLPGLNDLANSLRPREARRFLRARDFLRARHPQCDIHWVLATFPPPAPLSVYAFHVFNQGGLCQSLHTAGANHDMLLLTDTELGQSSLTIGYGLEPFVKTSTLDALLAEILPDLQSGKPARAAVRLIESWVAHLDHVLDALPRAFGLANPGELEVGIDEPLARALRRIPPAY
jgi:hypothetical protein